MKVTDYIIDYLMRKGTTCIFGYPGGVICHFIDSITKFKNVEAYITYNEQGAAFAACGYAQASHKLGVAFSTSGPGATNLVTGIANAYFDSIPVLFITGQVDTYALNNNKHIRQRGFQETDVVSMVKKMTKYAVRVDKKEDIRYCLEKAVFEAFDSNPGPVLLDLPADVQRADIDPDSLKGFMSQVQRDNVQCIDMVQKLLKESKRPVFLLGNGAKIANVSNEIKYLAEQWHIPVVTSLPAFDILPFDHPCYYGFIGTNGQRYANFVFGKADLVISIGSRLDIRQIGLQRDRYFKNKRLIRVDVDINQLNHCVVDNELKINMDAKSFVSNLNHIANIDFSNWNDACRIIKQKLIGYDDQDYNRIYTKLSSMIPDDSLITLDVGQNQIWFAQSAHLNGQKVFMSAGHGSMGYSLPAAIGVCCATGKEAFCFNGDGGIMMNLQELQFIKREQLPIKIICFNNHALGMIRGFQERNFQKNYSLTTESTGWGAPNFEKIAQAFDFPYIRIDRLSEIEKMKNLPAGSAFIEISYSGETNLIPNFGKTDYIQDQLPEMDRELFDELMKL